MVKSKGVHLKHYVDEGVPDDKDFDIIETELPPLEDGDLLLEIKYMSADPYLRSGLKSSSGQRKPGDVMTGLVSGKVKESKNSAWKEGDLFGANVPFRDYVHLPASKIASTHIWKLNDFITEDELSLGIGLLGMPGSTAYGGLIDVLRPEKGQTIFISAASGAVGSLVGQIAKQQYGCTVIGSCGGPEKVALIKEKFGFDHAIDYKVATDKDKLKAALKAAAPGGIDMYFENVGGYHFEAAYESLRPYGRIAICGGIAGYNDETYPKVSINPMQMIYTFQRMEGFVCSPWLTGKKGNFLADMNKWRKEGKLIAEETFFEGIESWPAGFKSLFTGAKVGKVVIRL